MYTQEQERKSGQLVPLRNGTTVKLLSQGGDHKVRFLAAGDDEVHSLESSEFFALFREATPAEIEGFEKGRKPAAKSPA